MSKAQVSGMRIIEEHGAEWYEYTIHYRGQPFVQRWGKEYIDELDPVSAKQVIDRELENVEHRIRRAFNEDGRDQEIQDLNDALYAGHYRLNINNDGAIQVNDNVMVNGEVMGVTSTYNGNVAPEHQVEGECLLEYLGIAND